MFFQKQLLINAAVVGEIIAKNERYLAKQIGIFMSNIVLKLSLPLGFVLAVSSDFTISHLSKFFV